MLNSAPRLRVVWWLVAALTGLLVLYAGLYRPFAGGPPPTASARLLVHPLAFLLYGLAVWAIARRGLDAPERRSEILIIVVGAVLLRALVLASAVPINPDLGRHLWEGLLLIEGHNPYSAPPADEAWDPIREELEAQGDPLYSGFWLKHAEVRSVYGPLATGLFAVAQLTSIDRVLALRLIMTLFDLATVLALLLLAARLKLNGALVVVYAWSPVCLNGFADRGQIDGAMIFFVVLSVLLVLYERPALAGLAIAAALMVKISPLLLLMPLLRVGRWRLGVALLLGCVIAVWPFRDAGLPGLEGFLAFADRWRSNDSVFSIVRWACIHLEPMVDGDNLARALVALAGTSYALWWALRVDPARPISLVHAMLSISVAVILLSPVTYPWYAAMALAFLCFLPRLWLLAATAAPMFWYFGFVKEHLAPWPWMAEAHGEDGQQPWRWPVYGFVYLLAAIHLIGSHGSGGAAGEAENQSRA